MTRLDIKQFLQHDSPHSVLFSNISPHSSLSAVLNKVPSFNPLPANMENMVSSE